MPTPSPTPVPSFAPTRSQTLWGVVVSATNKDFLGAVSMRCRLIVVHANNLAAAGSDVGLGGGRRFLDPQLRQAGLDGGGHAASRGLTGYAALVEMLDSDGHEIALSRSKATLDDESLLILTPPHGADGEEIADLIDQRRHLGPTLLVVAAVVVVVLILV